MEEIVNDLGVKTKIFAKTIEEEALKQIHDLCFSKAYAENMIRIMPDCHAGAGCTIGTTIRLTNKITPNLVGVDICCGMLVIELGYRDVNLEKLDEFINNKIPSGFNVHDIPLCDFSGVLSELKCVKVVNFDLANKSIGTLGGGNHFIEIDEDDTGKKYLVIHSGSRNLGVRVCKYYQDLAIESNNAIGKMAQEVVEKLKKDGRATEIQSELAKLPKRTPNNNLDYLSGEDFDDYIHDMRIMQKYAHLNRAYMSELILKSLGLEGDKSLAWFTTLHNYIDTDSMILRKGAVSAKLGEKLIIPMNMRDGSLMCVGKGNEDWNFSAPHGAGRLMSRTKAKETLSMDDFKKAMDGITSTSICESTLDEAPMAYKPMEEIIGQIKDTVVLVKIIKPIYNFKAK